MSIVLSKPQEPMFLGLHPKNNQISTFSLFLFPLICLGPPGLVYPEPLSAPHHLPHFGFRSSSPPLYILFNLLQALQNHPWILIQKQALPSHQSQAFSCFVLLLGPYVTFHLQPLYVSPQGFSTDLTVSWLPNRYEAILGQPRQQSRYTGFHCLGISSGEAFSINTLPLPGINNPLLQLHL